MIQPLIESGLVVVVTIGRHWHVDLRGLGLLRR